MPAGVELIPSRPTINRLFTQNHHLEYRFCCQLRLFFTSIQFEADEQQQAVVQTGEVQRGDLADAAQTVLEGVSMHMERTGARRHLHVVREPRRQRAPQLAIAIMPREAAQWTAQFVGPPALALGQPEVAFTS